MTRPLRRLLAPFLALAFVAAACTDDGDSSSPDDATPDESGETEAMTITLLTHDSFNISDSVLAEFTSETGIDVEILPSGDAGSMVNQAILSKDDPQGDVLFGIDNTFVSRAFDEDLFVPYESPALDDVVADVELDDEHRVTPIDTGDVCLNYDKAVFEESQLPVPEDLDALLDPALAGTLVVENPATSSPGLAFLLATVDAFGQHGWQDYWRSLAGNDIEVAAGWEEAYYGSFSGAAGSEGERPLVVSYASSPPAEVVFAEEPVDEAPTGVVEGSCYRQVEYAGILSGTEHEDEAGELIDFMLSESFQADIPMNMFVYPVTDVELPEEFVQYGAQPEEPFQLEADVVAEHRDAWIEEWTEIVLR